MSKNVLVVGATSGIAQAVARQYAAQGARMFLLARDEQRLQDTRADLLARGAALVDVAVVDLNHLQRQAEVVEQAVDALQTIDVALLAHGILPDQSACESDAQAVAQAFHTNTVSTLTLLTELANQMQRQQSGCLAVITSVAGDRGRPSNYVYGASKAAVSTFLQGLRARLHKHGVAVLDIRPGFVATAMTAGLDLPPLLTASAEGVAADICRAIQRPGTAVLYTPFYWRYILWLVRLIPVAVFNRLKL